MRACTVAYTFYESDHRVRRYAESLAKRGHEVDALALRQPGQPEFEMLEGVRVHRIQARVRNERGALTYLWRLLAFLARSSWTLTRNHLRVRYDLVHVHSVPDFEVFAALVPRLTGARVILDIHDIVPEFYASKFGVSEGSAVFRLLMLAEKLSAGFSSHVIIANHLWHTKLTARSVPASKCTPLINYPDPHMFSRHDRPIPVPEREFIMCYPGSLNWHQGVDRAIEAVALLREKAPQLRFQIIGAGPDLEMLQDLTRKLRLEDRVTFRGVVPIEGIAEAMSLVHLGVVPKRKDSFGNEAFSTKIMEFMAMGVPVIASKTRIDQYYFNENLVEFFDSDGPEDLAAKILHLIENPQRRLELIQNGSEFIRTNNWQVKEDEYLSLVNRLLPGCLESAGAASIHP